MRFSRKGSALFILLVICLYVLSLSDIALAKKSDKDKKKKEQKKSAKVEEKEGGATVNAPTAIPPIPKLPEPMSPGMEASKMIKDPASELSGDLSSIAQTRSDLELLSNRYDDLRKTHEEQLLSLRALASQAKIHAQLLDGIKANMVAAPVQNTKIGGVLDASNLEKYRLIRERTKAQKTMINEIAQSQARVKNALATLNIPAPPPSIKPPAGVNVKSPALGAVRQSQELSTVQNAVADAKEQQDKLRAEKEKNEKQEKGKKKAKKT